MNQPKPKSDDQSPEELRDALTACELERDQLKLGWQRCQADFENHRKRSDREHGELWQTATIDTLLKIAPILDTFRQALSQKSGASEAWQKGIEQIHKQLKEVLTGSELKRLEVEGVLFDPTQHEALSQTADPKIPEGHIIQAVESGYTYRGILVKPAKVVVSTGQLAK
jgi:molecular chaperone GrpE